MGGWVGGFQEWADGGMGGRIHGGQVANGFAKFDNGFGHERWT